MIPIFAAATFRAPAAGGAVTMPLTIAFPGGVTTATMSAASSIVVSIAYNNPGYATDYLDPHGNKAGDSIVQLGPIFPTPSDVVNTSFTFDNTSICYNGPGVYTFSVIAQRVATGLFDVMSNEIFLTVT